MVVPLVDLVRVARLDSTPTPSQQPASLETIGAAAAMLSMAGDTHLYCRIRHQVRRVCLQNYVALNSSILGVVALTVSDALGAGLLY